MGPWRLVKQANLLLRPRVDIFVSKTAEDNYSSEDIVRDLNASHSSSATGDESSYLRGWSSWLPGSNKPSSPATSAFFSVHFRRVCQAGGQEREVRAVEMVLRVSGGQTARQNASVARRWVRAVGRELATRYLGPGPGLCDNLDRLDRRRRILVLVNPRSGPGKAEKVFRDVLRPTLIKVRPSFSSPPYLSSVRFETKT